MGVILDRIPPQSVEAEQAALGAMLISRRAVEQVLEILEPGDFYHHGHRRICTAIAALAQREEPVDLVTVPQELQRRGALDAVGGLQYINTLADSVPTAAHAAWYARTVKERSTLRKLIETSNEIIETAFSPECTTGEHIDALLETAQVKLAAIAMGKAGAETVPAEIWAPRAIDRAMTPAADEQETFGVLTDIPGLDRVLRGMRPGNLGILAARPSMGKTSLSQQIALNVARRPGNGVLFLSLEMSEDELTVGLLANVTGINSSWILSRELHPEDRDAVESWRKILTALPLCITDRLKLKRPTLSAIRNHVRRVMREHRITLVIVDHLGKVAWPDNDRQSEYERNSQVAVAMKALAAEVEVPILLLCQLNRDLEKRDDKRPTLGDLRGSGRIEEEADFVLMAYRQRYYDQAQNEDPDVLEDLEEIAEVLVRKYRMGRRNVCVKLWCRLAVARWGFDPHYVEPPASPVQTAADFTER